MKVWMASLRRGLNYHHVAVDNQRKTACGRFFGAVNEEPVDEVYQVAQHGWVMPLVRAVDDYAARVCQHCAGESMRHQPNVVPSRDRLK